MSPTLPTSKAIPTPTFPINGPGGPLPESALELLKRTEFTRGRHGGQVSIVFPSVAELRVPISSNGYLEFNFWPQHSWLTIVEPEQKQTSFYDVAIPTGEKQLIARLPVAPSPDEEFAVGRDPSGTILIVADVKLGVLRIDAANGTVDVIVPPTSSGRDRRLVMWSPTGQSVAAPQCDERSCATEVIDTQSWTSVMVAPFVPAALTDNYLIGQLEQDSAPWQVVELATGEPKPVAPDISEPWAAFARTDGRFVVEGGTPAGGELRQRVYEIDPADGAARPIYERSTENGRSFMYDDWTTPDWVLLSGPENDQLILIDSNTGQVYDETLHTIDHPDG